MDITGSSFTQVIGLLVSGRYQDILQSWDGDSGESARKLLNDAFVAGFRQNDALLAQAALSAGCDMKDTQLVSNGNELLEIGTRFKTMGLSAKVRDDDGFTPLHNGASGGNYWFVVGLFSIGADVRAIGPNGETPLHLACAEGHHEIVQKLLSHWPKSTLRDKSGQTPLSIAASRGHVKTVRQLLEHWEDRQVRRPKPDRKHRLEALELARANTCKEVVELLEAYETARAFTNRKRVPLDDAKKALSGLLVGAWDGEKRRRFLEKRLSTKRFIALLDEVMDGPHSRRLFDVALMGFAPILPREWLLRESLIGHIIVYRGYEAAARMLVRVGADLNMRFHNDEVLVGKAAMNGELPAVKYMLRHGADPSLVDVGGRSPLFMVLRIPYYGSEEMVAELLAHGASPNGRALFHKQGEYEYWGSPLHCGVGPGIAEMLLAAGADPNALDSEGHTPLDGALRYGNVGWVMQTANVLRRYGGKPSAELAT